MKCVFCDIINGQAKAEIVFEDDVAIAFLDTKPLFHGHVLLVPREHHETLNDLPAKTLPDLFDRAQRLSRAVEQGMNAQGTFVAINNRVSQSVPHLHIHIVPRTKGDGLRGFFWPRGKYAEDRQLKAAGDAIRNALE